MTINVEPTKEHPIPYHAADDITDSFLDELAVTANTQEVLEHLAGPPELTPEDAKKAANLLDHAVKSQDKEALSSAPVAYGAKEFLRQYSGRLAIEMSDLRAALTHKLMELANCGDPKFELKAIELLGKHSDVGLFTERSEVTVNYKSSSDLEEAIKDRIKRLLNATEIEGTRLDDSTLDLELGVAPPPKVKIDPMHDIIDIESSDG
jgi:hypothetical protein